MGYTPTWALSFPDLNEIAKGRKAVMNLATSVEAALSRLKGDSATDAAQKADKALADAKAFTNSAKTELSSRLESLSTLVENETSARSRAIQNLRQEVTNLVGQARTTLLAAIATAKKEAIAESKELMDVRVPEPIGPGTTWSTYPLAGTSDGLEAHEQHHVYSGCRAHRHGVGYSGYPRASVLVLQDQLRSSTLNRPDGG